VSTCSLSDFRNDIGINQVVHQSISLQPVSLLRLRSTPSSGAISRKALKSIRSSPFRADLSSIRIRSASKPPFLSSDATDLRSSRSCVGMLNSILASPFFDCLSRCLFTASLCAGVIFISPEIYPVIYPVIPGITNHDCDSVTIRVISEVENPYDFRRKIAGFWILQ